MVGRLFLKLPGTMDTHQRQPVAESVEQALGAGPDCSLEDRINDAVPARCAPDNLEVFEQRLNDASIALDLPELKGSVMDRPQLHMVRHVVALDFDPFAITGSGSYHFFTQYVATESNFTSIPWRSRLRFFNQQSHRKTEESGCHQKRARHVRSL